METHIGVGMGKYIEPEVFSVKKELKISSPAVALDFCKKILDLVENGVNVKILTSNSGAADSEPANQLAQSFMEKNSAKGKLDYKIVSAKEIPLIHAKIYIIDQTCAITGSANFSNNSFNNFAEYVLIYREADIIQQIDKDFESLWSSCNYSKVEMPSAKKDFRDKIKKIRRKL